MLWRFIQNTGKVFDGCKRTRGVGARLPSGKTGAVKRIFYGPLPGLWIGAWVTALFEVNPAKRQPIRGFKDDKGVWLVYFFKG